MNLKTVLNQFRYVFTCLLFCCAILFSSFWLRKDTQRPCFVLMTDFGYDFAVGSMKGVILSHLPGSTIVDLDHSIAKFNVVSGSFVLSKSYRYFPKGTIFICVVDPGVGTEREPLCIVTAHYAFIGPNNGLFETILKENPDHRIYQISASYLRGKPNTFHGRDLFAPAAVDFFKKNMQHFTLFDKAKICHIPLPDNQAVITYIDSFGNIKTSRSLESFIASKDLSVRIKGKVYNLPFVHTFKDVAIGDLLCYRGSNNTLEIAVNQGSAAQKLDVQVGDNIIFER